jgi:hypothetical protein
MRAMLILRAFLALTLAFGPSFVPVVHAQFSAAPATPFQNSAYFGTGADGTVAISSGTTTLTRDMHYRYLTLSGTGKINVNGYRIYVLNTLDLSAAGAGAIFATGNAGSNASGLTPGGTTSTNGWGGTTPVGCGAAPAGGTPTLAVGGAGGASTGYSYYGGQSGAGGIGGAGVSAGGTAGATAASSNGTPPAAASPLANLALPYNNFNAITYGATCAGGGSAGGGDGTNYGGGGAGGAGSTGSVILSAYIIQRGSNATAGIIAAKGVTGGTGGTLVSGTNAGGGAGGGGGGGGFIWIICAILQGSTITNGIDVSGGPGGNGGNGFGGGKGGNSGASGNGGRIEFIILLFPAASYTTNTWNIAGSASVTTATITGATGPAGATSQANL